MSASDSLNEVAEPLKIAIYARVSTNRQDTDNQLIQLREFAAKQGWQIVSEYVDTVTGSGKKERPQFKRMMLEASQSTIRISLLFWKLDRLSREGTRKTLVYLTQLDSWGVAWRSLQEPFFDSCGIMKDVVLAIMSTLAEQERDQHFRTKQSRSGSRQESGETVGT